MIKKEDYVGDENNKVISDNSPNKQVDSGDNCQSKQEQDMSPVQNQVDSSNLAKSEAKKPANGSSDKPAGSSKSEEEGELLNEDDEEEEEDVPPDFFDDFSNQDFMDGLDIVDAWDDESGKLQDDGKESGLNRSDRKGHSPIRFGSKESHSKSSEKRSKRPVDKHARSRSRSPVRRRKRSGSYGYKPRSRSRSRDKNRVSDIRRDPEKTKRDINRDKIKCAKDKEQKIVSDKLKIVETGLVPPGTEMDIDLTSIIKEKRHSTTESTERVRDMKSERERRYSRKSSSRETRKTAKYSRSPPIYRSRNRERMDSNYRPRRRTSSMDSNVSERELWIRSSRKRSRSRSRESPLRLKSRKYEEKPKKKTFLEEIRDKLNEVRSVPVVQYSHPNMQQFVNTSSQMHSLPAPVPAPNPFFPQNQNNPAMQQYDQTFFIGDGYPVGPHNVLNQNVNFNNLMNNTPGNIVTIPQVQMTPIPQIPQISMQPSPNLPFIHQNASVSPKLPIQNEIAAKPSEQINKQTTDDIDKLFADKKISLSDFLTITAKCEVQSASPEHLQKKIKVISRCQDAIKAMSDDRSKFTGRLLVKPSSEPKNKAEVKYQSPLRRIPVVRFQFTSPAKSTEEVDSFSAALNKVLQKIGILKETIELDEAVEGGPVKIVSSSGFADEDTSALTLKASLLNSKTIIDTVTCEECKKRKLKAFADVGSQCADNKDTVSIGTQVNEDDLSPTKGLLKNDSIAYLTPAQLLGKEKEKDKEKEASPVTSVTTNEAKGEKKKIEAPEPVIENKKEKPKMTFKTRGGGFRKSARDHHFNSFDDDEFEYFGGRGRPSFEFEGSVGNFNPRYGTGGPPVRYPRNLFDNVQPNMVRMNQLRNNDGSLFTDFNHPFRGRGNRFGPRF